jgi:hypothetical protein
MAEDIIDSMFVSMFRAIGWIFKKLFQACVWIIVYVFNLLWGLITKGKNSQSS